MDTGQATKESTILGLSEDLLKRLYELQARLDNRFSRNPKEESKTAEVKSTMPNVLDEIIANLREGNERLTNVTDFISSEVLPKIN